MENILVLTDFTYSSFNAARYALKFAATMEKCKVIYYHSYNFFSYSSDDASSDYSHLDLVKDTNTEKMEDFETSLEPFKGEGTLVESTCDNLQLLDGIKEIIAGFNISLIVAGSKNRTVLGRILVGSQLLNVVENAGIPVLIVPPSYNYEPVAVAVFATDLTEVEKLPVEIIKVTIKKYHCKLLILNVSPEKQETSNIDQILSIGKLHRLFDSTRPEFHYINNQSVITAISEFCDIHHAGLLMLVHRKHSFMHQLFYRSVERDMIVHAHVPLLMLNKTENPGKR